MFQNNNRINSCSSAVLTLGDYIQQLVCRDHRINKTTEHCTNCSIKNLENPLEQEDNNINQQSFK